MTAIPTVSSPMSGAWRGAPRRCAAACRRATGAPCHDMQRRLQEAVAATRRAARQRWISCCCRWRRWPGFALDDMTQDEGWRLLRDRAAARAAAVCGRPAGAASGLRAGRPGSRHVEWLLEAYDSIRIYRSRYVVAPRLGPMLDLLVRDSEHPRALAFQCRAIARDLEKLAEHLSSASPASWASMKPSRSSRMRSWLALEADGAEAEQAARAPWPTRLRALAGPPASSRIAFPCGTSRTSAQDAQALAT